MSAGRQRIKSIRVAYLGPAYSFTHQAAIARFGEAADLVPVSTIATVFEEVNRGPCGLRSGSDRKQYRWSHC